MAASRECRSVPALTPLSSRCRAGAAPSVSRHRQHLRPGEPAVGSRARLVITAITTQGLSQAETARTYGLSQAWVSRLMAGYRVEGEACLRTPLTTTQGRLTQGAAR